MIRALGLSAVFAFLVLPGFAQETNDEEEEPTGRKSTHYIGIQANQLVKQILNLGGSSSAINNPYLITYSVNSNTTGVGLNVSLGYTINEFTGGDAFSQSDTDINEFFFRIGIEKKSKLGKRWILAAGGDVVSESSTNNTITTFNGGGSTVETDNSVKAYGTGFRAALNFQITDKILVGTEANYYFKFISTTSSVKQSFGSPVNESSDQKKFQLVVPAVIFLIVKL